MTPKWGFRVAMFPVGALCFYQAHFGRTVLPNWPLWPHLFYSVFYSVSELRRACFRQARVARAVLPPGALFFSCRGLCVRIWGFPNTTVLNGRVDRVANTATIAGFRCTENITSIGLLWVSAANADGHHSPFLDA